MQIVYPDADPQFNEILTGEMLSLLPESVHLKVFHGKPDSHEEYVKRVKDADAILLGWSIPNEVIKECPNLKIISFTGIGASNFIDLDYAKSLGVIVTNTPGYADNAVAEHALALLLSLTKNITGNHQAVSEGIWDQSIPSIELKGRTIGLIGMGDIGKRMATFCKALGMNVICWTFNPSVDRAEKLGVVFTELDNLLTQSDIISLHLPLTEDTKNFLGEKELALLKRDALLINTSRAEIVDSKALIDCLSLGRIAGAGIDVFDEEPVPSSHPLLKLPNVILSPHIGFNTKEATIEIMRIAIDNLAHYYNGRIKNAIN